MNLFLNIEFAWVSLIIAFFMVVIYFLRVLNKNTQTEWVKRLNRSLRKKHKALGIILIIAGLLHGIFSSDKAIGFNLGTFTWISSILLGLSYLYRKRFNPQKLWMVWHRIITAVFVILLTVHIIDVGGFIIDDLLFPTTYTSQTIQVTSSDDNTAFAQGDNSSDVLQATDTPEPVYTDTSVVTVEPTAAPTPEPTAAPIYIDGVYTATADGFRPGLTVEVEIRGDQIIRVEVISHNEVKDRYWSYPVENIPLWIVEAQSTDVDTVSGATCTSEGIIDAVDMALEQALNN